MAAKPLKANPITVRSFDLEPLGTSRDSFVPEVPTKHYMLNEVEFVECYLCFHIIIRDPKWTFVPSICPECAGHRKRVFSFRA